MDYLSAEAQSITSKLISLARSHSTTHSFSLFEHTDSLGRVWFVKRFMSIELDLVKAELESYQKAHKLGLGQMLVRPKVLPLPDGKTMLIWPKLKGRTLGEHLASGAKLTSGQRLALAAARQLDEAIGNPDRNLGNVWVEPSGRIRLIDQDLAKAGAEVRAHASGLSLQESKALLDLSLS